MRQYVKGQRMRMIEKKCLTVWIPVDIMETALGCFSPQISYSALHYFGVSYYLQSGAHEPETSIFNGKEMEKDEDDSGQKEG